MDGSPPVRRPLIRRPKVLLGAVLAGAVLGFGLNVAQAGGWDAWLAARGPGRPVDWPTYDPRGSLVEVDGRGVYLDCRGASSSAGQPTVILEAGFGSGAAAWGHTFDGVAAFARVCAWDRPGLGRSEGRGRHSAGEAMDDLLAALAAAGERGPYVVAGHSFGGVYARILAGRDPELVAGIVMIDAYYPDPGIEADPSLPADFREAFGRTLDETAAMLAGGEDLDWDRVMAELAAAGPFGRPAILLSVMPGARPFSSNPDDEAMIRRAFEAALARMFPNGRLEYVPDTGHLIQIDRPEVVIDAVRELLRG